MLPELANGVDLGYEYFWADKALFSVATSTRAVRNYTRQDLRLVGGRWLETTINAGDARTKSLDVELKFPFSALFATTVPLAFQLNASRNWSSVSDFPGPANRLAGQTPSLYSVRLDYKAERLSAGGYLGQHTGGMTRVAPNQYSYRSTRRDLEAYLAWRATSQFQYRVSLSNLLHPDAMTRSELQFDDRMYERTAI